MYGYGKGTSGLEYLPLRPLKSSSVIFRTPAPKEALGTGAPDTTGGATCTLTLGGLPDAGEGTTAEDQAPGAEDQVFGAALTVTVTVDTEQEGHCWTSARHGTSSMHTVALVSSEGPKGRDTEWRLT